MMVKANEGQALLAQLVEAVLESAKYRDVSPDLIRSIGQREIARRGSSKEAIKATKNKLHQVSGAYLDGREAYDVWLDELRITVRSKDRKALRQVCQHLMSYHASTRERLPMLEQFYSTLLADLSPVSSILDLACGLNPLAIPWMPLTEDITYYAYDIHQRMMDFLHAWLALMQVSGHARSCDIISACPKHNVDVAFVFKTIPCLEQIDKQAGVRLLHTLNARHMLVSFPIQSLGGRGKGMASYYEAHFREMIGSEAWHVERHEFATELVFVVSK